MGNLCCFKNESYDNFNNDAFTDIEHIQPSVEAEDQEVVEEIVANSEQLLNSDQSNALPSFVTHPFICDRLIVKHLQSYKVMFVMRGVPGSGKSTLVKALESVYPTAVVCSADKFWITPEGNYEYDIKRLKEAHNWCQNMAFQACERGDSPVIIDNTNVKRWEFKYYVDLANRFRYLSIFVEPQTPWRFNPEMLHSKGIHGVPLHVLEAKVKAFEEVPVPVYFAWFLNESTGDLLRNQAQEKLSIVNNNYDLRSQCGFPSGVDIGEVFNWLKRSHVTAMFCDRGRVPQSKEYARDVQANVGCVYALQVDGFLFTSRVIAAVVGLFTSEADKLWNNGDQEGLRRGAKAHVTLATADRVQPVQAGVDLLLVLSRIQEDMSDVWDCGRQDCHLLVSKELGDGCLIQLKEPIDITGVFSALY